MLLSLSEGIWFIAYLTPKKQMLIEAIRKTPTPKVVFEMLSS
jgi:hypothetical protein